MKKIRVVCLAYKPRPIVNDLNSSQLQYQLITWRREEKKRKTMVHMTASVAGS